MPVTGSGDQALLLLIRDIDRLGSPWFRQALGKALGATALKLIDDGFRAGRDPYGKAWPPPKLRTGKTMVDTGRTAASFSARPTSSGFAVGSSAVHLRTSQAEPFIIRPVRAKALRFRGRGKPTAKNPRGRLGKYIFAASVKTVQRLTMPLPERGMPPAWGAALNREADAVVRDHLGVK